MMERNFAKEYFTRRPATLGWHCKQQWYGEA